MNSSAQVRAAEFPNLTPVILAVTLGIIALVALPRAAAQTTFYWDRNGSSSGAGNTDATLSGIWDTTTTANWNTNSGGITAPETFTSGGNAVFSAGTSASGRTYTITVSGTQNTSRINVQEGTVTFSGGTAINFNDATPDFIVASGLTTTVDTNITGSNGLNKLGAGTLIFASNDKSYTGTTAISAGVLQLNADQNFSTVSLAGGILRLNASTFTITTLNVTSDSIIDFAGTASSLNLTNLVIGAGVTLTIQGWQNAVDYLYTQNFSGATLDSRGTGSAGQVVFSGFSGSSTIWQSYDRQVTPVPEPAAYGAALLGALAAFFAWRRRRISAVRS